MFGLVPTDSAAAVFRRSLDGNDMDMLQLALPWWTLRRDTVAIVAVRKRADLLVSTSTDPEERQRARYLSAAASAYLPLARQDTAAALTKFLALPDSLCPGCYRARFTTAQLLVERGERS